MALKKLKDGCSTVEYAFGESVYKFEPGIAVNVKDEHVKTVMNRIGGYLEDVPEPKPEPVPEVTEAAEEPKPKGGKKINAAS